MVPKVTHHLNKQHYKDHMFTHKQFKSFVFVVSLPFTISAMEEVPLSDINTKSNNVVVCSECAIEFQKDAARKGCVSFGSIRQTLTQKKKKKENKTQLRGLQQSTSVDAYKKSIDYQREMRFQDSKAHNLGEDLHHCAYKGDFEGVKELYKRGANMKIGTSLFGVMYYYKRCNKSLDAQGQEFIGWLIDHGADVHCFSYNPKQSLLMLSVEVCKERCCSRRFLDAQVKVSGADLAAILTTGDMELIQKAIALHGSQGPIGDLSYKEAGTDYYRHYSALDFAQKVCKFRPNELTDVLAMLYRNGAQFYSSEIESLAKHGFNLESRDSKDRTPLIAAIEQQEVGMVKKLLIMGANPHALTHEGLTALEYAQKCATQQDAPHWVRLIAKIVSKSSNLQEIDARINQLQELINGSPVPLKLAQNRLEGFQLLRKEFWIF